jgi:hypothetical protein
MASWNNNNYVPPLLAAPGAPAPASAANASEEIDLTQQELRAAARNAAARNAAARAAAGEGAANANNNDNDNIGEDELVSMGLDAAEESLRLATNSMRKQSVKRSALERSLERIESLIRGLKLKRNTLITAKQQGERKQTSAEITRKEESLERRRQRIHNAKNRKERAEARAARVKKAIDPDARSALLDTLIGLRPIDNIRGQLNNNPSAIFDYHRADICGPDMRDIAQGGAGMKSWFNNHKCTSANPREWYDRYISSIKCLTGRIFAQEQETPEVPARPAVMEGRRVVIKAQPRIPPKPAQPPNPGHQAAMNYAWAAAKGCYQLIKRYQGKNSVNIKRRLPKNASKRNRRVFTNAVMNRTTRRNPRVFNKNFKSPGKIGYIWAEPYRVIADKIQLELSN